MSAAAGSRPPGEVLPGPSLKALRAGQTTGLSRRTLIRRALGAGVGLLAIEWLGGSLAFAWSAASAAAPKVRVGTLDDIVLTNPDLPVREGFPTYLPAARAFVVLLDPGIGRFETGSDATGDGAALNVRALSQSCPHLGCRPNPCVEDFWFRCPCHQSRYDRLGTKADGELFGPAPRGHGPVRHRGRCGRRPDDRHRGGHARAAPRGAWRPGYHPATRRRRLHMTGVLRLYPRWWRRRYGDEMRALLDVAPARRGDRRDLARGALDAWLHPPEPSYLPALAALLGGGIWTMVAARVVSQPVQPDWPGYLMEVVPFAIVAAIFLLIAVTGIALRAADAHARSTGLAIVAAIVSYGAWIVAMAGTVAGVTDPGVLWATQTVAMVVTAGVGLLVRSADERLGIAGHARGRRDAAAVGRCLARLRDVLDGDRAGHPRRPLAVVRRAPPPVVIGSRPA